ncbi:MAG TPA: hypothetical protein VHZ24_00730 [Pirellulales bacterium]|nr:hypothetical protein [Pirellulales bacterium]
METHVALYRSGAITSYQLVVDCLHMLDPAHPEHVLAGLPPEIYEEMLDYARRYDPTRQAPKERLMPALDQVHAATTWIERQKSTQRLEATEPMARKSR